MFFNTPISKTINSIKQDFNYIEDTSKVAEYAAKNQSSTIITPFTGENNIFFKVNKVIRHIMDCGAHVMHNYEKQERYLQINTDGNINIFDEKFHQVNEPVTDYLFSQEALNLKNKWLAAGEFKLWEKDFGNDFILYYVHKGKNIEIAVNLYIDRKGETCVRTTVFSSDSMDRVQYDIPKDKADAFNFSYQALAIYLLEQQAETLQYKGNMPSLS